MKIEFSWLLIIKEAERKKPEGGSQEELFAHWERGKSGHIRPKEEEFLSRLKETAGEEGFLILLKGKHGNDDPFAAGEIKRDQKILSHLAIGRMAVGKTGEAFQYTIEKLIDSPLQIQNLLSTSDIGEADGTEQEYIYLERSGQMLRQAAFLLCGNYKPARNNKQQYEAHKEESYLAEYAQRNENCERVWGLSRPEPERSEFQRDRERIVNSRAFRRLVDKAQIFTSSKGDHYRTRMTHTLEVAQIARSIANSLQLNIDLTEAIALGHDLGHTPFGHQGERTLDDILKGRIDIGQCLSGEQRNIYGGFKHNFQSVRVLCELEEKYAEYSGLDVSFQILEGVLKHTSCYFRKCDSCSLHQSGKCKKGCCDLKEFIDEEFQEKLYPQYWNPTTLEGQVVAIADEIAQRSHDLDDAFSSGLLNYEEFCDYLKFDKMSPLRDMVLKTYQRLRDCDRSYIDFGEMLYARIISDVINYLVNDTVQEARRRIGLFLKNGGDALYQEKHRFSEKLVDFTVQGGAVCRLLEKLISKKAINCLEVTQFDRNAEVIIRGLFQAYLENPRLMHEGTLRKMYLDMQRVTGNALDFLNADPGMVRAEFERIRKARYNSAEEYWLKNKILMRCITDYIAGMTDSYAVNEYERLKR